MKITVAGTAEMLAKQLVTNREHLEEEAGDLLCMLQLMMEMGVLSEKKVYDAALQKRAKLHKWSNIFTHDVTTQ